MSIERITAAGIEAVQELLNKQATSDKATVQQNKEDMQNSIMEATRSDKTQYVGEGEDYTAFTNVYDTTIIKGNNYAVDTTNAKKDTLQVKGGETYTLQDLQEQSYVDKKGNPVELTEAQQYEASCAIFKNNATEMAEDLNSTYLAMQIGNDLSGVPEEELEQASDLAFAILNGEKTYQDIKNDTSLDLSQNTLSALIIVSNKTKNIGTTYNYRYETIDENTKPDDIPPEVYANATFTPEENQELFIPDINTLDRSYSATLKDTSFGQEDSSLRFESKVNHDSGKEGVLEVDISNCKTDEEKLQVLQDAIAENYNLVDEDGEPLDLNCDAGINILSSIAMKYNDEIFDNTNEPKNLNEVLQTLLDSANEEGEISFVCTDANLSVLGQSGYDRDNAVAYRKNALSNVKMGYMHVTDDAVNVNDLPKVEDEDGNKHTPASGLLEYVQFDDNQTMLQALEEAQKLPASSKERQSIESLAATAVNQLINNNQALQEAYSEALEEAKQEAQKEGKTVNEVDFLLNFDVAQALKDKGNGAKTIDMESIRYVVQNTARKTTTTQKTEDPVESETTLSGTPVTSSTPTESTTTSTTTIQSTTPSTTTPPPTTPPGSSTPPHSTTPPPGGGDDGGCEDPPDVDPSKEQIPSNPPTENSGGGNTGGNDNTGNTESTESTDNSNNNNDNSGGGGTGDSGNTGGGGGGGESNGDGGGETNTDSGRPTSGTKKDDGEDHQGE